jgi:two-component system, cell cycle response regulator
LARLGGRYDRTLVVVTRRKTPAASATSAARREPHEASLVVVYGTEIGRRLPLTPHNFTIGRSTRCDLIIDQKDVSRKHAQIVCVEGRYTIVDEGSSNGVHVNDQRIREYPLSHGDKIQIGQTLLTFLSGDLGQTRYQDEIYRLMTVDAPTGAYNRRYFCDALEREGARALRHERHLSIVLFEIDGFARILAERGRLAADAVLRKVVASVRAKLRQKDILGRLGDAQFGVLLPEMDLSGGRKVAEKLRAILESAEVAADPITLRCTLSLGAAALPSVDHAAAGPRTCRHEGEPSELLALAHSALVDAKRSGGNRVSVALGAKGSSCPR